MSCIFSIPEGWETARVEFQHRNGKKDSRIEMINFNTGKRYLNSSPCEIATKCFLLALAFFPYLSFYATLHAFRAPLTAITAFFKSVQRMYEEPTALHFGRIIWDPLAASVKEIGAIVRAPFYAIGMQFAALYGILRPFEGLQYLEIERAWHQKEPHADFRCTEKPLGIEILIQPDYSNTFYFTFCLQPIGTIHDSHLTEIKVIHEASSRVV